MRACTSAWLLVGCGNDSDPAETTPPSTTVDLATLQDRGPFGAGSRVMEHVGTDGIALTSQVWYPTSAPEADVLYASLVPGFAATNGEPSCGSVRGLVAFSHGYGGLGAQSPFLTEHLASHGYVVVAPDHVGSTLFDLDALPFEEVMLRRPIDLADSVDAILADDALGPCLDEADGYVAAGHSYGGYTALAAAGALVNDLTGGVVALGDPRVKGAIGLAPWDAAGGITDGTAAIEVPVLILTGERDATTPLAQVHRLYDPLVVEPRWLGVMPDGGHNTFSPIACAISVGDGCGDGWISAEVANPLINGAVTLFVEGVRGTLGAFEAVPVASDAIDWESAP